jgi:HAMP domain-containing protein
MAMGLRTKFNLMLFFAFTVGLTLAAGLSYRILQQNAREEVIQNARIMMESALGIRGYTVREIRPLLALQMKRQFLPQSVSAYAAMQNFQALRDKLPDYTYREAALNPTNPSHRPTDWEADIIREFRNNTERQELITERDTPTGRILNLAHLLQIKDEGCLQCHGKVEDAPKTVTDIYGTTNGFGWKLNDIVGAQIVSVPMTVPLERAWKTFLTFIGLLEVVFFLIMILLNILLHIVIIKPVLKMSKIANEVSLGNMDIPEYTKPGKDEIASLSASFNRMRRSLENALKMLGE